MVVAELRVLDGDDLELAVELFEDTGCKILSINFLIDDNGWATKLSGSLREGRMASARNCRMKGFSNSTYWTLVLATK